MKIFYPFLLSVMLLSGATPEQVERYLLVSGSEDQLIDFEQMIDGMSQMLTARDGQDVPLMQDSQMVPIRFREYLQRNLSETEMDEVLANYRHDVLRKLVSAEVLMEEPDTKEAYRAFAQRIEADPLSDGRTQRVSAIIKNLYDEELLINFFNKMFLPMVKQMGATDGREISQKQMEKIQKDFVAKMRKSNELAMLFMTRDFTDEELEELEMLSGNSATRHETRAVFGAIISAMEEAMDNMAKRFGKMARRRKAARPAMVRERNATTQTETNRTR